MDARVYSGSGITFMEEKEAKEKMAAVFSAIHHDCMVDKQPKGTFAHFVRHQKTTLLAWIIAITLFILLHCFIAHLHV